MLLEKEIKILKILNSIKNLLENDALFFDEFDQIYDSVISLMDNQQQIIGERISMEYFLAESSKFKE